MFKIGDEISYHELTGKIINIFSTDVGEVLEVECPPNKTSSIDIILWLPVAELIGQGLTNAR